MKELVSDSWKWPLSMGREEAGDGANVRPRVIRPKQVAAAVVRSMGLSLPTDIGTPQRRARDLRAMGAPFVASSRRPRPDAPKKVPASVQQTLECGGHRCLGANDPHRSQPVTASKFGFDLPLSTPRVTNPDPSSRTPSGAPLALVGPNLANHVPYP